VKRAVDVQHVYIMLQVSFGSERYPIMFSVVADASLTTVAVTSVSVACIESSEVSSSSWQSTTSLPPYHKMTLLRRKSHSIASFLCFKLSHPDMSLGSSLSITAWQPQPYKHSRSFQPYHSPNYFQDFSSISVQLCASKYAISRPGHHLTCKTVQSHWSKFAWNT
jgi:hypothetical protein